MNLSSIFLIGHFQLIFEERPTYSHNNNPAASMSSSILVWRSMSAQVFQKQNLCIWNIRAGTSIYGDPGTRHGVSPYLRCVCKTRKRTCRYCRTMRNRIRIEGTFFFCSSPWPGFLVLQIVVSDKYLRPRGVVHVVAAAMLPNIVQCCLLQILSADCCAQTTQSS